MRVYSLRCIQAVSELADSPMSSRQTRVGQGHAERRARPRTLILHRWCNLLFQGCILSRISLIYTDIHNSTSHIRKASASPCDSAGLNTATRCLLTLEAITLKLVLFRTLASCPSSIQVQHLNSSDKLCQQYQRAKLV